MNIEKLFTKDPEKEKYASSLRRSLASGIDIAIVVALRTITIQLLGMFWINRQMIRLQSDFKEFFGTDMPKGTPQHMQFIFHHPFVIHFLLFIAILIFIGALYHALLNSSSWRATVGKRVMGIMLLNKSDESVLSFSKAMLHYFLSVMPFAFIVYLIIFQAQHDLSLVQAVTASNFNSFFSMLFLIWLQPHLFTKKRTTSYDIICKTVVKIGKTEAKFPWSK
jgi:uncharacterized RDD family membrane protein YckC